MELFDLCGRNPSGSQGKHFANSVFRWFPLVAYCIDLAPDICAPCQCWLSNDGDGLDADGAAALASALQDEVDGYRTHVVAIAFELALEKTPNEPCPICLGSGTSQGGPRNLKSIRCNRCEGAGYVRPLNTYCSFSVENVVRFIAFLRESGGFKFGENQRPCAEISAAKSRI
jgi:hypothetical protein